MSQPTTYCRAARGRPAIGFQLEVPREVELREGPILHGREVRPDGRTVGEVEISVFAAALVIDRDGILEEQACEVMSRLANVRGGPTAVAVTLPGGSGFRSDAMTSGALPYVHVFTLAPPDLGVDGGILVAIRCAGPEWPAVDHMLRTLRIVTRNGRVATNYDADDAPMLPIVTPRR